MTERTALITGASGGIGSVLCEEFRRAGFFVIATDSSSGNTDADAFVEANLRDLARHEQYRNRIVAAIRNTLPSGVLSVLVNNAAVQFLGSTRELTEAAWHDTLDINVVSPFLLVQQLLPELERGSGSVVNIASIHATLTKPAFTAYATSKAALVGLTRSLAVDLGGRVRVNAICPAAIDTPMLRAGFGQSIGKLDELASMHPARRIGSATEVARAALFFCRPENGFLTGTVMGLDGGIGCRLHDPL